MNIYDYYTSQIRKPPEDETLKTLGLHTNVGVECVEIIDSAQFLIELCDPAAHDLILAGVQKAISVKWHG